MTIIPYCYTAKNLPFSFIYGIIGVDKLKLESRL